MNDQTKAPTRSETAKAGEDKAADPLEAQADADQAHREAEAERAQAEIDAQKKAQDAGTSWSAESPPDEIVSAQALAEEEAAKAESGDATSRRGSGATDRSVRA